MRYFLACSYKGTNYHGWQIQPNAITVQQILEEALTTILQEKISIVGCGRTDTGVHAKQYFLHFDVKSKISNVNNLSYKLNSFLPNDIAVSKVWEVDDTLHARFDAKSRTYKYYISTFKDPFSAETAYLYTADLDIDKMNAAAEKLLDYEDFTSFSKLHTDVKTNLCTIFHASWEKVDQQLIFTIKANRFLRNMVRAIVGTLMEVGKGRLSVNEFCYIIGAKDRAKAGASAPAHGLFLYDIEY